MNTNKTTFTALTIICSIFALILLAPYVHAAPVQLSYDDGSSELSFYNSDSPVLGEEFGAPLAEKLVRFTPTGAVKILSVETYWTDTTGNAASTQHYNIRIYNSSGSVIYGWSANVNIPDNASYQNRYLTFNLSSQNIVLKGDFYVDITAPISGSGDEMNLGTDRTAPAGRSYTRLGANFIPLNQQNYMIRATVESTNLPPTLAAIIDSPDPIMSGSQITVTPLSAADANSDALSMVCGYSSGPTMGGNTCTNDPQNINTPYAGLNCLMPSDANNQTDTIFCRLFDGLAYSAEKTAQSTDDNTPPAAFIMLGDAPGTDTVYDGSSTVYATLASSDASGINSCEIDWGAGYVNILPVTTTALSNVFTDGNYTVKYRCYDNVGWDATYNDTIIVDLTPPTPGVLTVTGDAGNEEWDTDGNVHLSWTAASDANGIDRYVVIRSWTSPIYGSQGYQLIATVNSTTLEYDDNGLVPNTTYTYYIGVYDVVGHSSSTNTDFTTVDTDKPSTQITAPVDGNITNNNDVAVSVAYSNTYNVTCTIQLDSDAPIDMPDAGLVSGTAHHTFNAVSDGSHTIVAVCTDLANLTSSDSVTIFVDSVAPIVTLQLGAVQGGNDNYDTDGTVWARVSNSDPGVSDMPPTGSGVTSCELSWDNGGSWNAIAPSTNDSANFYAADGDKIAQYRCTDAAGNVATPVIDNIFVDRVAPVTTVSLDGTTCNGVWYSSSVSVTLNANDPGAADYPVTGSGVNYTEYSIDGMSTWTTYTGPFVISTEGITTVYFHSIDMASNVESVNSTIVRIDTIAPAAVIVSPVDTEHFANPNVNFSGFATDSNGLNGSGLNRTEILVMKTQFAGDPNIVILDWTPATGVDSWYYNAWTAPNNTEYIVLARSVDNACNVQYVGTTQGSFTPDTGRYFTVQANYDYRYYTKPEIDAFITNLSDRITSLEGRVNVTEQEIAALQGNVSGLWIEIQDLHEEDAQLWGNLTLLDSRLTALEQTVRDMNHGTLNLEQYPTSFWVFGEAPVGATYFSVKVFDANDSTSDHKTTGILYNSGLHAVAGWDSNANYYEFNIADASLPLPRNKRYVVVAEFYYDNNAAHDMPGYFLAAEYDKLYLQYQEQRLTQTIADLRALNQSVNESITNLWNTLYAMNHGTMEYRYFDHAYGGHSAHTFEFQGEIPAFIGFQPRFTVTDDQGHVVYQKTSANDFACRPSSPCAGDRSFYRIVVPESSFHGGNGIFTVALNFNTSASTPQEVVATVDELAIFRLEDWLHELEHDLRDLEDVVDRMNHGTVNTFYQYDPMHGTNNFRVFGEAPEGACSANIMIKTPGMSFSNSDAAHHYTVSHLGTHDGPSGKNTYEYTFEHLASWEPVMYNVVVTFNDCEGRNMRGYTVGQPFYGLFLHEVDTTLWGNTQACADLGMSPQLYNDLQRSYSPHVGSDAQRKNLVWRLIEMLARNQPDATYGDVCSYAEQVAPYVLSSHTNSTDVDTYVTNMPLSHAQLFHQVFKCIGLEDEVHLNWLMDMCQQDAIDRLEHMTHGFAFQPSATYETFQQQTPFGRSMVWGLNPKFAGNYRVELMTYWTTNTQNMQLTQRVAECQPLQKDYMNEFFYTPWFPATWPTATQGAGLYKANLIAVPCGEGNYSYAPEYVSNTFSIELKDLADNWPTYGVNIVSSIPGPENEWSGVFYTNRSTADIRAMLGANTTWMNDLRCEVWNYKKVSQRQLYASWDFESLVLNNGSSPLFCSGDVDLTQLQPLVPGVVPQYTIEMCAHPIAGQVGCDKVTIGYDTHAPNVQFVYPQASTAMSGTKIILMNITDDGVVRYATVTLINKTNAADRYELGVAHYNMTTGLYEISIDTLLYADGYYNLSVNAWDYAGNMNTVVLDPIIDNTAPVVQTVSANGAYGANFNVNAHITDVLAGVHDAKAELRGYTCNSFEATSCTANWCENVPRQQEQCGNSTVLNETCYTTCRDGEGSGESCVAQCTSDVTTCETMTVQVPVCDHSTSCHEIEGQNINTCVSSCEQGEGHDYCVSSCYSDYCGEISEGSFDLTTSCTQNCLATTSCSEKDRTYDEGSIEVVLTKSTGSMWDGIWTGQSSAALDKNKHYAVYVLATDNAGNVNTEENYLTTVGDYFSTTGYVVSVNAGAVQYVSTPFTVSGSVVASDGSMPTGNVVLAPWSAHVPFFPMSGLYSASQSLGLGNGQVIMATYTPDASCPGISYNATAVVNVQVVPDAPAPTIARSGGGGGSGGGSSGCSYGYVLKNGICVKETSTEQPKERTNEPAALSEETKSGESLQPQAAGTSGTQDGDGTTPVANPATGSGASDSNDADGNLLTGNAAGAGAGASLLWLWIVLVVVAGVFGYMFLRRRN